MHGSTAVTVKIVRRSGEFAGTLSYGTNSPWEVLEPPDPEGRQKPFRWEVVIRLPETVERRLLFFDSRSLAKRWAKTDPRAEGFNWSGLTPPMRSTELAADSDLARSFLALAEKHGALPESPRAFQLAREAGLLNTLVLYDEYGANRNSQTPLPVPPPNLVSLPWMPKSCRSAGSTYFYDQNKQQIQALQASSDTVSDCIPGAVYARTT